MLDGEADVFGVLVLDIGVGDIEGIDEVVGRPDAIDDVIDIAPAGEGDILIVVEVTDEDRVRQLVPIEAERGDVRIGSKRELKPIDFLGFVIEDRVVGYAGDGDGVPLVGDDEDGVVRVPDDHTIEAQSGVDLLVLVAGRIGDAGGEEEEEEEII